MKGLFKLGKKATNAQSFDLDCNRGKNWIESDSLILIDVYQSVMSSKGGTILTFSTVDLLDGESASILNDRIAAQFLASSPVVSRDGQPRFGLGPVRSNA